MLLSRVAENLYWAARYLERAEDTARIVLQHTNVIIDMPDSVSLDWSPLLAILGDPAIGDRRSMVRARHRATTCRAIGTTRAALWRAWPRPARTCAPPARCFPRAAWQAINDLFNQVGDRCARSRPAIEPHQVSESRRE